MDFLAAIKLLNAATETTVLVAKAIEAANNGNEDEAANYLNTARKRYDQARADWDAAGETP